MNHCVAFDSLWLSCMQMDRPQTVECQALLLASVGSIHLYFAMFGGGIFFLEDGSVLQGFDSRSHITLWALFDCSFWVFRIWSHWNSSCSTYKSHFDNHLKPLKMHDTGLTWLLGLFQSVTLYALYLLNLWVNPSMTVIRFFASCSGHRSMASLISISLIIRSFDDCNANWTLLFRTFKIEPTCFAGDWCWNYFKFLISLEVWNHQMNVLISDFLAFRLWTVTHKWCVCFP